MYHEYLLNSQFSGVDVSQAPEFSWLKEEERSTEKVLVLFFILPDENQTPW